MVVVDEGATRTRQSLHYSKEEYTPNTGVKIWVAMELRYSPKYPRPHSYAQNIF